MPSVGMRRSTRSFRARVLRSGRRMCTEPHKEWKYVRAPNGGNEWIELLENSAHGGGIAGDDFKNVGPDDENRAVVGVKVGPTTEESEMNTMRVMVYRRKRKRGESTSDGLSEDKRFGKKFARRQWREEKRGNFVGSVKSRSSDKIQKMRSSLRRKRGGPPSSFHAKKSGELLVSDFIKIRHGAIRSAAVPPSAPGNIKELKSVQECSKQHVRAPAACVIPIPDVQEVPIPVESNYTPYVRPDSYINVEDDELTRALVKTSANYDMDSDDEKWLNELNQELYVTPEIFELVIDALEKGFYCNPDDYSEDKVAYVSCLHLERKEVVAAICNYWIKKRKQKHAALVRIFQLFQPRRTQVIPNSVLRKKRSFKRRSSQVGRGKQLTFLQARVTEQDPLDKLQEAKAKAFADRSEVLCVLKRERAQMLMENADLATYKAMMALRIAEAAQVVDSPGTVASFSLG